MILNQKRIANCEHHVGERIADDIGSFKEMFGQRAFGRRALGILDHQTGPIVKDAIFKTDSVTIGSARPFSPFSENHVNVRAVLEHMADGPVPK